MRKHKQKQHEDLQMENLNDWIKEIERLKHESKTPRTEETERAS
jgi:hypothetical protein